MCVTYTKSRHFPCYQMVTVIFNHCAFLGLERRVWFNYPLQLHRFFVRAAQVGDGSSRLVVVVLATSAAYCRRQLQIRCLGYLNDLKFVIFCHSEYICRSFFKTRNSRTSKFHVVFLFPREFSGVRFTFRIAKHVKFIHFNLPSTIISCARILSKKKIHLYVNEN